MYVNSNGGPQVDYRQWDNCLVGHSNYLFDGQPFQQGLLVPQHYSAVEGVLFITPDNSVVVPSIIPGSSMDIFAKSFPDLMLKELIGGEKCAPPTAEVLCEPFRSLGPFSCTKTTPIQQTVLQVLGSALSNASSLFGALVMGFAWTMEKYVSLKEAKQGVNGKIAPKDETKEDKHESKVTTLN
jgi:hypothetical protein